MTLTEHEPGAIEQAVDDAFAGVRDAMTKRVLELKELRRRGETLDIFDQDLLIGYSLALLTEHSARVQLQERIERVYPLAAQIRREMLTTPEKEARG